jgi:hypothetical protein
MFCCLLASLPAAGCTGICSGAVLFLNLHCLAAAAAAVSEALAGIVPPLEALQGKGKLRTFRKAVREMLAAELGLRSGKQGAARHGQLACHQTS